MLGEFQGYYPRYWWWDVALPTGSGQLPGIPGVLLEFALNEKQDIQLELHPEFIVLIAFLENWTNSFIEENPRLLVKE